MIPGPDLSGKRHLGPRRFSGWILIVWLLLAGAGLWAGSQLEARLQPSGAPPAGSESARASRLLRQHFPQYAGTPHVLVAPVAGGEEALRARLRAIPQVRGIAPWSVPPPLSCLLVFTEPRAAPARVVDALRHATAASGKRWFVTGPAEASVDLFRLIGDRLGTLERISLVVSGLVLFVVFGGPFLTACALAAGLLSLCILPLAVLAISGLFAASQLNMAIAAVFTLALGLDYPLFFLSRLREEYHGDLAEALKRAIATAGRTLATSAAIMAAGGLSLLLVPMAEIRSIGLTVAVAALLAAGLTLSFLPELLSVLGRRWSLERWLTARPRAWGERFWDPLARLAADRPVAALVGSLVVLAFMIAPVARLKTWSPYISQLPSQLESKQGLELLVHAGVGGSLSPLVVVWSSEQAGGLARPEFIRFERQLRANLRRDPRVAQADGVSTLPLQPEALARLLRSPAIASGALAGLVTPDARFSLLRLGTRLPPDDPRQGNLVASLRRTLKAQTPAGIVGQVGGMQAELLDTQRMLEGSVPGVAIATLIAIYLLLGLYLRSLLLPLKALLVNCLPVLAALGGMVVALQGPAPGQAIQSTSVLVLASVLFAISMDYELFMLARIREQFDATAQPREAVIMGMRRSGRIVVGAALVLLSVFVPYMGTGIRGLTELGLGLSLAILVDATLVRFVLVPATMVLLGRWNFWVPLRPRSPSDAGTRAHLPDSRGPRAPGS